MTKNRTKQELAVLVGLVAGYDAADAIYKRGEDYGLRWHHTVRDAFLWDEQPEGFDYWMDIHRRVEDLALANEQHEAEEWPENACDIL